MKRPFRERGELDYTWLIYGGIAVALVAVVALIVIAHNDAVRRCEERGGVYVHTSQHRSVCFKKGVIAE